MAAPRRVLLVIDMQRDFVSEGGALSFPAAREILPFVREKVRKALQEGWEVVFTLDTHKEDDLEFKKFPPHCLEGTEGHRLVPELEELISPYLESGQVSLVRKSRYSAFHATDLEDFLGLKTAAGREALRETELVGVCTNICCFFTAEELANRDVPVRTYARGLASFDGQAHACALDQMEHVLGITVERE